MAANIAEKISARRTQEPVKSGGDPLEDRIIRNIHRIRVEQGLTRTSLAERLNMHIGQLSNILHKRHRLSVEMVERCAAGLGVDPSELVRP